jgi:hypothetical protein
MTKTQSGRSRARTRTVEIAIRGEGELVICFIDKSGQTLLQERLTVSGSPKIEALRIVELRRLRHRLQALSPHPSTVRLQCRNSQSHDLPQLD